MKKLFICGLAVILCAAVASAATISVDISTDKALYLAGETVYWTCRAWSSDTTDNYGLSLISVDLEDSLGEVFNAADHTGATLTGSYYDFVNFSFVLEGGGGDPGEAGKLQDIVVRQVAVIYNVGNDGSPHAYAQGNFEATIGGMHTLSVSVRAANYYPDDTGSNPVGFASGDMINGDTQFEVVPEPATLMLLGLGGIALLRRRS